jgi:hypothetical protein
LLATQGQRIIRACAPIQLRYKVGNEIVLAQTQLLLATRLVETGYLELSLFVVLMTETPPFCCLGSSEQAHLWRNWRQQEPGEVDLATTPEQTRLQMPPEAESKLHDNNQQAEAASLPQDQKHTARTDSKLHVEEQTADTKMETETKVEAADTEFGVEAASLKLIDPSARNKMMSILLTKAASAPLEGSVQAALARKLAIVSDAMSFGSAACAIAFHMVGFCHKDCKVSAATTIQVPSWVEDLGRCIAMLDKYPEFRERILEMGQGHGFAWTSFAENWTELERRHYLAVSRPWYDIWTPAVEAVGSLKTWWTTSTVLTDADAATAAGKENAESKTCLREISLQDIPQLEAYDLQRMSLEEMISYLPNAFPKPGMLTRARDRSGCGLLNQDDPCFGLTWSHVQVESSVDQFQNAS